MPESCFLFYIFEGKILKIKTSNANAPWVGGSSGVYINAPGSFLFLLENPHNDALTCFECNITAQAMIGHGSYGPIFGSDDMRCHNAADTGRLYTCFLCHRT